MLSSYWVADLWTMLISFDLSTHITTSLTSWADQRTLFRHLYRCHSVGPHSFKPRSLEPYPLSRIPLGRIPSGRIPLGRIPLGRIPISRIPFSRTVSTWSNWLSRRRKYGPCRPPPRHTSAFYQRCFALTITELGLSVLWNCRYCWGL